MSILDSEIKEEDTSPRRHNESHEIKLILNALKAQLGQVILDRKCKWCDQHENLLKLWKKQAAINLWLQLASNYYYSKLNDYLSYPSIVLSAATSISVFGSDCDLKAKFAISILALVSGVLTAINKHLRAAEKGQEYALRAKDYHTFIREIDFILATNREERPNATDTLERIRGYYDRIVDMQMEPPVKVIRSYEKKFRPLENSLFSDLKSEMRSNDSFYADRVSPFGPNHTQSGIPKANKETMLSAKISHKQIKNLIYSPYQLFNSNAPMSAATHPSITLQIGPDCNDESRRPPIVSPRPPLNQKSIDIDLEKLDKV